MPSSFTVYSAYSTPPETPYSPPLYPAIPNSVFAVHWADYLEDAPALLFDMHSEWLKLWRPIHM